MNREKISSLAWLLVSVGMIAGSSFYAYGSFSQPGPAFLPLWCGIILAVLSSISLIQTSGKGKRDGRAQNRDAFLTLRCPKLVIVLCILLAFAFLLETCGYILMTFASMFALLKAVGSIKWRTAFLEAILATMISYILFEIWLKVPLPAGFFPKLF